MESGSRRLEAKSGDLPISLELETDRDEATPIHRWKAEDKLRDWQDAVAAGQRMTEDIEEEAGEGGWVGNHNSQGFQGWCIQATHTKLRLPTQEAWRTGE